MSVAESYIYSSAEELSRESVLSVLSRDELREPPEPVFARGLYRSAQSREGVEGAHVTGSVPNQTARLTASSRGCCCRFLRRQESAQTTGCRRTRAQRRPPDGRRHARRVRASRMPPPLPQSQHTHRSLPWQQPRRLSAAIRAAAATTSSPQNAAAVRPTGLRSQSTILDHC